MIDGGIFDQEGKHRCDFSSEPHTLAGYLLCNEEKNMKSLLRRLSNETNSENKRIFEIVCHVNTSLTSLLSDDQKKELRSWIQLAYPSQVENILKAKTPKDFLYRSAELIATIRQTPA